MEAKGRRFYVGKNRGNIDSINSRIILKKKQQEVANPLRNYFLVFVHSNEAFKRLLSYPSRMMLVWIYVSITAFLYTLMYVFLTIAEAAPSTFTPWLNISKENYYYYNQFLLVPSLFLCWILASGFVQILSRVFNGKGTFEETFILLGVSVSVAMWPTLIHDLTTSFLSAIHVMDAREHELAMNTPTIWRAILWICMAAYVVLFIALFSRSVRVSQKISVRNSVLVGTFGFILFQIVFLIFNR